MTFNPLSGKNSAIAMGGSALAFGKWTLRMRGEAPDVSNFTSGGFETNVAGLAGADITLEGPYDSGNMPITLLSSYAFTLTCVSGTTIAVTARITELTPVADVKDAVRLSVSAKSLGVFTAALA